MLPGIFACYDTALTLLLPAMSSVALMNTALRVYILNILQL